MEQPNALLASSDASALVVIDVQERLAPAMDQTLYKRALRNARILVESAHLLEVPVIVTEQYPRGLGHTVGELAALIPNHPRMEKTRFSCSDSGHFDQALAAVARHQVILAGMESHVCVLQSALELAAVGKQVFVVEDACCSRTPEAHQSAMQRLRTAGVAVAVTESILFEWLRDSRHEQFKAISALLR